MKEMAYPTRKPLRLSGYNYSTPGAYFVTLCVQNRRCLFALEPVGNGLCAVPPAQNQIIHKWLKETENKFGIVIDKYVVMPNHVHLLVRIVTEEAYWLSQTERHTGCSLLEDAIQWFKTMTTNAYIQGVKAGAFVPFEKKLWQKSYYDHVIRGEADYKDIWTYIDNNPAKWQEDHLYMSQ